MLLRVGIYSIFLIMMLVKCILPDEKPEIIPLPQQSVLDKGDFIFDTNKGCWIEYKIPLI